MPKNRNQQDQEKKSKISHHLASNEISLSAISALGFVINLIESLLHLADSTGPDLVEVIVESSLAYLLIINSLILTT